MSGQLSMNVGRWFGNGPRYVRALHTLHAVMHGSIASYVLQTSGLFCRCPAMSKMLPKAFLRRGHKRICMSVPGTEQELP